MKNYNYLIIGGGVAGTTAAETIRKLDEEGSIAIISDEPYPIYSRLLLSQYVMGKVPREKLFLKPENWYQIWNIEFLKEQTVTKVDDKNRRVLLTTGEKIGFEKLLIACGGKPCKWEVCQKDLSGVCRFQSLSDAEKIIKWAPEAKNPIVVGGGFIGLELCELFLHFGLKPKLLIVEPYVWANLVDLTQGKIIEEAVEKAGVEILRNTKISEVLGNEKVEGLKLGDGTQIPCDLLGIGIGVYPDLSFLSGSHIKTKSGILANEFLETSVAGIFAAGDACEFYDVIREEVHRIGNWGNAMIQGKVAGQNMAGEKIIFRAVTTHQVRVFDLSLSFVGDCVPCEDLEVVDRGSKEKGKYGRLLFSGKRIVGATLVNLGEELPLLQHLIEKKTEIPGYEDLADINVPLVPNLTTDRAIF